MQPKSNSVQAQIAAGWAAAARSETGPVGDGGWTRAVVEDMRDGVCLLRPLRDRQGTIVDFGFAYINPAGARINQISQETHLAHTVLELFPRLFRSGTFRQFVNVVESGQPWQRRSLTYRDVFGGREATRKFDIQVTREAGDARVIWRDVSEVDDAFDRLNRSNTIVESSPNPIITVSMDGSVTSWNPAAERVYGYPAAEITGRSVTVLECREHTGESLGVIKRIVGGAEIKPIETAHLTRDGRRVDVMVTFAPIRDPRGTVVSIAMSVVDIGERLRAQEEMRMSQAYNRGLIEASLDGLVTVDPALTITDVNESLCRLTGYRRDELVGSSFPEHFTDVKRAEDGVRLTFERGDVNDYELTLRTQASDEVLVSFNAAVYTDPANGAAVGIFAAARDITQRRRVEQALRESEARLNEAQRIAHIGNWALDLVTNELIWSDEIYRIFEIDPNRFGASYEAFLQTIHPDDRDMVNAAYTESVANHTPYDIVHRLLMSDGRVKYVNERCETHYDGDGRPIRSVGTVHDITDRRHTEDPSHR